MSTTPPIPERPEDLTAEWLTAALASSGLLRDERVVRSRWRRIGEDYGFTGVIVRVELDYEPTTPALPRTVIAKLPLAHGRVDSGYRGLQESDPERALRYYRRCTCEARFYRDVVVSFAPRHYYSDVDDEQRSVVILLEDVAEGRQGDVLAGCSVEEAGAVIEALASLHAEYWGERSRTPGFPKWGDDPRGRQQRFAAHADDFLSRYGTVPDGIRAVVDRLRTNLASVASELDDRRQTLIHADAHLDNVLFDARADRRVTVLDWQTVSAGPPAWDLAMLLAGSPVDGDRGAAQSRLLGHYLARLSEHGVRDYSSEELLLDYRLALLVLLAGTVLWVSALDPATLRGRERALHDAAVASDSRLFAAVLENDAATLVA